MGKPEYNKGPLIGEHGVEIVESLGYKTEEIQTMLENKELYVWKDKE
jgi:cinnamoyl-CoA:phenyllactate CoA-transferase